MSATQPLGQPSELSTSNPIIEQEIQEIERQIISNNGALPRSAVTTKSQLLTYAAHICHPQLANVMKQLDQVNDQFTEVHK